MQLRNVRRWQWIVIGVAAGAMFGAIRQNPPEDLSRYERVITGRREFENALIAEFQGVRRFTKLTVYPGRFDDGGGAGRAVHIVAGSYFDGQVENIDGNACAVWRRACFVAERPYEGVEDKRVHATVMAFLDTLSSGGSRYAYAWWREPLWAIVLWATAGMVAVGLIWPTIINLLAFGSIFRPREEKGFDLGKAPATAPPRPADPTSEDMEKLARLDAQMESKLASDAARVPEPEAPPAAPVRQLLATKLDESASPDGADEKSFGQDKDDFYPTELHGTAPNGAGTDED